MNRRRSNEYAQSNICIVIAVLSRGRKQNLWQSVSRLRGVDSRQRLQRPFKVQSVVLFTVIPIICHTIMLCKLLKFLAWYIGGNNLHATFKIRLTADILFVSYSPSSER